MISSPFEQKDRKKSSDSVDRQSNTIENLSINYNFPLNEKDFDTNKLVHQKEHKLKGKINLPYIFQITTNQKTKISVSHNDKNGNKKLDCNTVASKDSLLKFELKRVETFLLSTPLFNS